jgi:putative sigma-54 modulation protein
MNTIVTCRHFKAHEELVDYAKDAAEKLDHYYDGIIKCEIKLSYHKAQNSVKVAEVILTVYKQKITAKVESDDYHKSIDGAIVKVLAQVKKYKEKLHAKNRVQVRRVQSKAD